VTASRDHQESLIGRSPEQLTFAEKRRYSGVWVAFELYSPRTTPLRKIAAAGDSAAACIEQLAAVGLDPRHYEFVLLQPPTPW